MECQDLLDKLYLLIDGELAEQQCVELRAHLEDCHPCLDRMEMEQRFKQMLATKCSEGPAPEDLVLRIQATLRSHSE